MTRSCRRGVFWISCLTWAVACTVSAQPPGPPAADQPAATKSTPDQPPASQPATDQPVAADAGPRAMRDLVRIAADEPWLRIHAGGHTAAVRALAFTADSTRLCSAGLDKDVEVWNMTALGRDLRRTFLRERTIRWQVARGLRGSIYALAASPTEPLLALGGYGAMGSLGEILVVNPVDGTLVKAVDGMRGAQQHRETVLSLAFSSDGQWLAAMHADGESVLRRRDAWQPITLYGPDRQTYSETWAQRTAALPKRRPIAFLDSSHVCLPIVKGVDKQTGQLTWAIQRIAMADPQDRKELAGPVHQGMVTALTASFDGTRLVSADLAGNLYVWDLAQGADARLLRQGADQQLPSPAGGRGAGGEGVLQQDTTLLQGRQGAVVASLGLSRDGKTLAVGTASADGVPSRLELWNLETRLQTKLIPVPDAVVQACAISPDGKRLAYTGGRNNEVFVAPLDRPEQALALQGTGRRVLKVAFAAREPLYRVAWGTEPRPGPPGDRADLAETFDTTRRTLGDGQPPKAADWLSSDWQSGGWTAQQRDDKTLALFQNGQAKGVVSLGPQVPGLDEGRPDCYCWLPDAQGRPFAIVVGTQLQNSIYVCRLVERGVCPILRHFRGHHDDVTSVGVSRDLRYVVSGSADGTLGIWSLSDCDQGTLPGGRWGAAFVHRKAPAGEQLVAAQVHPAGPLYHKGVREGDVLVRIGWLDPAGEEHWETDAGNIYKQLQTIPWATQVWFETTRNAKPRKGFQLLPAWQPVASLFVDAKREWAFWTPAGYYDSSVNGYRLFGWQVNRGLDKLPDFFRADQFFQKLERPDVMGQLLRAGSLPEAFRLAAAQPPTQLNEDLPHQIAATPRIQIVSPLADATLAGEAKATVQATIDVPAGVKLVTTRVSANGVVATGEKLIQERDVEGRKELTYQWDAALPRDQRNLIQVVVGTDAPTAAFSNVIVNRSEIPPPRTKPKLFLLALGINQYGDPQIQSLSYPVADAQAVLETMRSRSQGLYELDQASLLTDRQVTPKNWREALDALKNKLAGVAQPDDLLVFFFAGHGIVNEADGKYYFVGYDVKLGDINRKSLGEGICWDDFQTLRDIPCRKVAMLDTCYAGAIQPPSSSALKVPLRALQEDVVFTVAASTGEQKSAEQASWRHGAFTKCVLDGLGGRADRAPGGNGDGVVTLDELVEYVQQEVPKLTDGRQTPTAAPDDILPATSLPLTKSP